MKKNKGISLIVLIITIVVIIILATAIIVNLAETNIIGNANEAVVKQDFKTFESELDLYIADEYTTLKGKLDVTIIDATTKEDVAKIIPSIKGTRYEEYITIVDGKIVVSDEMPEEQKIWVNEVITLGTATPVIQAGTKVTTANSSITGKKFSSTNPVIPVGFKTSTTGASWTVKDGVVEGWNDGLVIVDGSGNEFVWVPCTLDGANGSIKYAKWCTKGYAYNNVGISNDIEALPMKDETTRISEIDQITTYGGFYIGRYEAGVPTNQTSIDGTSKDTSDKVGIPVVQKYATVWTYVDYTNANTNAKSFINTANVKSSLVTGTAWDTACAWIQSETDSDGNPVHDVINNSTSWGNYNNDPVDQNNGKQVAGSKEGWKAKNIYDLAGNAWEWSGENYSSYHVYRGGGYNLSGSDFQASYRGYYNTNGGSIYVGTFRIMLHVM